MVCSAPEVLSCLAFHDSATSDPVCASPAASFRSPGPLLLSTSLEDWSFRASSRSCWQLLFAVGPESQLCFLPGV